MKRASTRNGGSQLNFLDEIIVDNFAGGGGASTGMELATGRPVAIAINHDPDAILMHKTNHPFTEHLQASVWDVDPRKVCRGRPVGLAWFSPDCKHFSKAKGAALVDRNIRGLAWIVLRWAGTVRPRVIILENVEEFVTWGPVRKGRPVKKKAGQTFQKWKQQLLDLGYAVEHREIVAADLGAPTTRKRFVLIARCDGRPMAYKHGVYTSEVETSLIAPVNGTAGLIVAVGTAPVNMLADPAAAVNKPILVNNYKEAVEAVGYVGDFEKYTLCECISAAFSVVGVAPMVFINVLDPAKHTTDIEETTIQVNDGVAALDKVGVLLDELVVKKEAETLEAGTDYTTVWNTDGTVNIVILSTGAGNGATQLTVSGKTLDPSKVTAEDIVGGVDIDSGKETGMEVIRQVYPMLGMTPGILIAPRYSMEATVAAALQAKTKSINSKEIIGENVIVFVSVPSSGGDDTITAVRVYDNNDALAGEQTVSLKRTSRNTALLRFTFPLVEAE